MDFTLLAFSFIAAVAAGIVNAIAGGGTLITFPLLTALGLPAVSANITNTVALTPGYFGGAWAQREEIKKHSKRLSLLIIMSVTGGIAGGILLLKTGEKRFTGLIPYLILFATLLIAIQPVAKDMIVSSGRKGKDHSWLPVAFILFPATLYGGYFGAGVSIVILAALGLMYNESIASLNALKQLMSLCINLSAAVYFLFSGMVNWPVAVTMAAGAILGGYLGGRMAGNIRPSVLRWTVVIIGIAAGIYYLLK